MWDPRDQHETGEERGSRRGPAPEGAALSEADISVGSGLPDHPVESSIDLSGELFAQHLRSADAEAPRVPHAIDADMADDVARLLETDALFRRSPELLASGLRDAESQDSRAPAGTHHGFSDAESVRVWARDWAQRIQAAPDFAQDYEILELVAVGGMSLIYRARQRSLDRIVALKVVMATGGEGGELVRRLQVEAQALVSLRHPNIVAVHEIRNVDELWFLSMDFIDGISLERALSQRVWTSHEAAKLTRTVAETIQFANEQGVLHRDLKPSNILLARDGTVHVMDFGLAKRIEADGDMTRTGQIIGTPGYIAPEQTVAGAFRGHPTIDVYGLGAILYAMLTGAPPFRGPTVFDTLLQVREADPQSPRVVNSKVAADLETICLKCLRKRPEARYQTARELADDLDRFLHGKPIVARPVGVLESARMWARRNPSMAASVLIWSGLLLVITAGLVYHVYTVSEMNHQLVRQNSELHKTLTTSHELRRQASESADRAHAEAYASAIEIAAEAWHDGDIRETSSVLGRYQTELGPHNVCEFTWHHFIRRATRSFDLLVATQAAQHSAAYSNDGRLVASGGADGLLRIIDVAAQKTVQKVDTGQREINGVTYSPDGRWIVTTGDDATARIWNAETLERIAVLPHRPNSIVFGACFTPDSESLVTCGDFTESIVWNTSTWSRRATLEGVHTRTVEAIDISEDGMWLATASSDQTLAIWDLATFAHRATFNEHAHRLTSLAFSPDSRYIATGDIRGRVVLRDVETGRIAGDLRRLDGIQSIDWSARNLLAVGDRGGVVSLWDARHLDATPLAPTDKPLAAWATDHGRVYSTQFAPDGDTIVTSTADGRVQRWACYDETPIVRSLPSTADYNVLADSQLRASSRPEGLLSGSPDGVLQFDVSTRTWTPLHSVPINICAVDTYAKRNLMADAPPTGPLRLRGSDGQTRLWDLDLSDSLVVDVQFVPNSDLICVLLDDGRIIALDVRSGLMHEPIAQCDHLAIAPAGDVAVVAQVGSNALTVYSLPDWKKQSVVGACRSTVRRLRFHPDGTSIASASDDRSIALWSMTPSPPLWIHDAHDAPVRDLDFSSDGETIVSCDAAGVVKLTMSRTGRELLELATGLDAVERVKFSANGHWLYCVDKQLNVVAFDGRPLRRREAAPTLPSSPIPDKTAALTE